MPPMGSSRTPHLSTYIAKRDRTSVLHHRGARSAGSALGVGSGVAVPPGDSGPIGTTRNSEMPLPRGHAPTSDVRATKAPRDGCSAPRAQEPRPSSSSQTFTHRPGVRSVSRFDRPIIRRQSPYVVEGAAKEHVRRADTRCNPSTPVSNTDDPTRSLTTDKASNLTDSRENRHSG